MQQEEKGQGFIDITDVIGSSEFLIPFEETPLPLEINSAQTTKVLKYTKWNDEEKELYIAFLSERGEDFRSEHDRRSGKVFLQMSTFIENRNSEQCRSHHQKMFKKHGSISKIIRHHYEERKLKQKKKQEEDKKQNKKKRSRRVKLPTIAEQQEFDKQEIQGLMIEDTKMSFELKEDYLENVPEITLFQNKHEELKWLNVPF